MNQTTLQAPISLSGVGLHSGENVKLTLLPAPPASGLRFFLSDSAPTQPIHALAKHVTETTLGTTLSEQGGSVQTVEHLMSALFATGVDNVDIHLSAHEVPILDGSAKPFIHAILQAGLETQAMPKSSFSIKEPISLSLPEGKFLIALPHEAFRVTFVAEYPGTLAGCQTYSLEVSPESFIEQIAAARTFAFWEEVEALQQQGFAKGGSFDNAIVVYQDRYSSPLRFPDELVRHKVLDLIGDLALTGCALQGHFIAIKSGHQLNTLFAKKIVDQIESEGIHARHR